jgi:hypothetical protein
MFPYLHVFDHVFNVIAFRLSSWNQQIEIHYFGDY